MILLWGFQLINSDALYVNYASLLIISIVCTLKNLESQETLFETNHIINVFAILLSCMVALANYRLWGTLTIPEDFGVIFKQCYHFFVIMILFVGGFFVFRNICISFVRNLQSFIWNKCEKTFSPIKAFSICFSLLIISRLIFLFCCQYPGELTKDSIVQMVQVLNGNYSNHHPFYHTMVIKAFVMIGMYFFHDINAAVATYSVFQIIFSSFCFAFTVKTVAQIKAPRWIVISLILFFVLMPYHIIYSITMWKDVMFGFCILLFIITFFRCMHDIGNAFFNHSMLIIAGIGTCLFRSNGLFVFILLTVAFAVLWKTENKRMLIIFISTVIISLVMKHPVLTYIGVTQPDTIESLSIPVQQISRAILEGCELNERQRELLGNIVDIDKVADNYSAYLSDPIKDLVREKGNQQLLVDHKFDYIKLYFSLGIKNPMAYLRAWIDQTRGYWNAGYETTYWSLGMHGNSLGIEKTIISSSLDSILKEYFWLFKNIQGLKLFLSIGFFVWIDILMFMITLLRKDKVGVFVTLPILAVVISLLVATPVFAEFRYIYSAFCSLPIVVAITFRPLETFKDK